MGLLRIAVILALAAAHIVCPAPAWLMPGGAPYMVRALSYSLFHASWWHLAVNCLAVWAVFRPGRRGLAAEMAVALVIAFLVYPLSFRPVIGFSNVLYAVIGMRTPPLSSRWWRSSPVIIFLALTAAMVAIPMFSATTHVASLALGVGCAHIGRWHKSLMSDVRRYL